VPTGGDEERLATLTPLRGIRLNEVPQPARRGDEPALWFVTVTVSGDRLPADEVRRGLERLSEERPFLVSAGYASSRAEVRYWDESVDVEGAVAQALRMWADHQRSAGLPDWRVVGLEVVDRDTARRRWNSSSSLPVLNLGEIRALDA
jgi:hypothetical protein